MPAEEGMLGLVGPGDRSPCGIRDYLNQLAPHLEALGPLRRMDYAALEREGPGACRAVLVHYEASLVPDPGYMARVGRRFGVRLFVVPHEVYEEDPFAFPYALVRSRIPGLGALKRVRYRWNHRAFEREKRLQKSGYHAGGVIPLMEGNAQILQRRGAGNLLPAVPLAGPPETPAGPPASAQAFSPEVEVVVSVFGFLNPATDYRTLFAAVSQCGGGIGVWILGGNRVSGNMSQELHAMAGQWGLETRVRVSGFIPEGELPGYLAATHAFVCPYRFRSNSSSLLRLIGLGKPILASAISLVRELESLGAPVYVYSGVRQLVQLLERLRAGELAPLENRYPFTYPGVARLYRRRVGLA